MKGLGEKPGAAYLKIKREQSHPSTHWRQSVLLVELSQPWNRHLLYTIYT